MPIADFDWSATVPVANPLQAGRLPFWNPYIFSGLPLAANSQAVVFYPLSVLGATLPLNLALTWDFAFHLLWTANLMTECLFTALFTLMALCIATGAQARTPSLATCR